MRQTKTQLTTNYYNNYRIIIVRASWEGTIETLDRHIIVIVILNVRKFNAQGKINCFNIQFVCHRDTTTQIVHMAWQGTDNPDIDSIPIIDINPV